MNDFNENNGDNGDGGYGVSYITVGECKSKCGELVKSMRENRTDIHGVPGGDGGMKSSLTELWSEWNTFKGLVKFLLGSSLLLLMLNLLTLLRMFNVI